MYFCCVINHKLEGCYLVCRIYSDSRWNSVIYDLVVFTSYLRGGCEERCTLVFIPSNYRLVSGQRESSETVPLPREWLSLGGHSELISLWFVADHIHGTNSSTPMSRYDCLALVVTYTTVSRTLEKTLMSTTLIRNPFASLPANLNCRAEVGIEVHQPSNERGKRK